jgi:hypothetical protein
MVSEKKKKVREWLSQHESTVAEFNDLRKSLEVLDIADVSNVLFDEVSEGGLERVKQVMIDEVIKSRGLITKPKKA